MEGIQIKELEQIADLEGGFISLEDFLFTWSLNATMTGFNVNGIYSENIKNTDKLEFELVGIVRSTEVNKHIGEKHDKKNIRKNRINTEDD